ncbi:glycosyltransferase family 2 protein [Gramella lutea]|uniref:Glycosyltransferase family 2 protein n=1 Tax=Christiangramia lutea TaxID=1607951 RepID=A0A9X2A7M1_9FLAO|nr:glycosyltransferase family 2 protein [Christiangramia lutea]MCH4821589.1 glycosyltransferase family 2 protein [Christiangramia lutea]
MNLRLRPRISVIVPNYNHARFLRQRLESVFNQTYLNIEVIILDDASTDASRKVIDEFSTHPKLSKLLLNKSNSGSPFKQWKKGIELARGDYIWIAESDDYCKPDFLEKIVAFLKENKNIPGLIYAQSKDVDEKGSVISSRLEYTASFNPNIWKESFCLPGNQFVHKYLKVKNVIPNASAVVFKKTLVDSEVLTKELLNMKFCGDWLFWIRLSSKTQVCFLSQELNYFRGHTDSSRNHREIYRLLSRLYEERIVRDYLDDNFQVDQKEEVGHLYETWLRIHKLRSVFNRNFYKVKLRKTSYLNFIYNTVKQSFI